MLHVIDGALCGVAINDMSSRAPRREVRVAVCDVIAIVQGLRCEDVLLTVRFCLDARAGDARYGWVSMGAASQRVEIDLLYLNLDTCDRCQGADRNLDAALEATSDVLALGATK